MKAYVKKLLDIRSLRNVKFCDYESYNILWEEVYKEKLYVFRLLKTQVD